MPLLSLLTGPLGKLVGYAGIALAVVVAGALWLHSHDNSVRAALQAKADVAIAAQVQQDHDHEVAALQQAAADAQERIRALSALKARTHSVPSSSACVQSPPVRALIGGLRQHSNGARSASPGSR